MLYLYTIFMLAWDLDKDTHSYFRFYLNHFINLRKVSKNIRTITHQLRDISMYPYPNNNITLPNMKNCLHNTSQVTVGGGKKLILPKKENLSESISNHHIHIDEINHLLYY